MPQAASALERDPYLRALVMGSAKVGKSTSIITSLATTFGQGYVFCCGDTSGMAPATRRTKKFVFDKIRDENDMEAAIKEARRGVKESEYTWVFVDDYSLYASWLEGALRDDSAKKNKSGEADGRRYWPEYKQRILNVPRRLFDIRCHIVFATHYIEQSPEIQDNQTGARQRAKEGVGIVPMFGGSAREELPALFKDVIFMEKDKTGKRVFQVNPEGVWGPGCRSADGTHTIEADFGAFMKLAHEFDKKAVGGRR